jgi:hypothetical protein
LKAKREAAEAKARLAKTEAARAELAARTATADAKLAEREAAQALEREKLNRANFEQLKAKRAAAAIRAEGRIKPEFSGEITDRFKREVQETVDKLDDKVMKELKAGGVTIRAGENVTQLRPELKGDTPRGGHRDRRGMVQTVMQRAAKLQSRRS